MTKYKQAKEAIRHAIVSGQLQPGDRLPSIRKLMDIHGVSYSTITHSLRELRDAGLIEPKWGKGIFVSQARSTSATKNIAVVFQDIFETTEPPYVDILRGVDQGISKAGWQMHLISLPRGARGVAINDGNSLTTLVREGHVDAIVSMSPDPPDMIEGLCRLGVPLVTVMNRYPSSGASCVSIDAEGTAGQIARYLVDELGHTKINLVLGPKRDSSRVVRSSYDIGQALSQELASRGVDLPSGSILWSDYEWQNAEPVVRKWLTGRDPPTAIFVCHWALAESTATLAGGLGLNVPTDLSVLGYGSESEAANLTSIRIPLVRIGQQAVNLIEEGISGNAPRMQRIESELVVRGSCCPPKS